MHPFFVAAGRPFIVVIMMFAVMMAHLFDVIVIPRFFSIRDTFVELAANTVAKMF